jgi:thioredoxin 1
MPVELVKADTAKQTIASSEFVVIDFFATWCGPCKMVGPKFEEFSNEAKYGKIKFLKIDVDEDEDYTQEVNVEQMPTFIFFKGGKEADRLLSSNPAPLQEALDKLIQ